MWAKEHFSMFDSELKLTFATLRDDNGERNGTEKGLIVEQTNHNVE